MRGGENLETRARSVSERLPGRQLSLTPLRLDSFSINSLSVDEWSLLDWVFIELARSEQDSRAVRYIEFTSESTASGWMRSRSATRFLTCTEGGGVQGVGRGGARRGGRGVSGGEGSSVEGDCRWHLVHLGLYRVERNRNFWPQLRTVLHVNIAIIL